jgi:hypothetical protein
MIGTSGDSFMNCPYFAPAAFSISCHAVCNVVHLISVGAGHLCRQNT